MTTFVDDNTYVYYNRRPDGKRLQDCVCRAISTATGIDYYAVENLLEETAKKYKCEKLCVCCYHNLLEDKFGYKCQYCKDGEKVQDIAKAYLGDKVIIRIHEHLTCSINGIIPDIWDCSKENVDCFWVVK